MVFPAAVLPAKELGEESRSSLDQAAPDAVPAGGETMDTLGDSGTHYRRMQSQTMLGWCNRTSAALSLSYLPNWD